MSDRVLLYVIIGAFLFAIGIGMFTGWHIKPNKVCPVIKDTVLVKGNTVLVPYPVTVIKWKEKQPAVETLEGYTAMFDSEFVSHKDTIGIKSLISFNDSTKDFEMDMDIKHKDYESFRVDSVKYTIIETKEIDIRFDFCFK